MKSAYIDRDEYLAARRHRRKLRYQSQYSGYWKLYVLELEHNKYYVGITHSVTNRLLNHMRTTGAAWTRKYKPLRFLSVEDLGTTKETTAKVIENKKTKELMERYGRDNVRGGVWCDLILY